MYGPSSTAGKIDAFETRFTVVNGAHFLIVPNGKAAWPISAAEAQAFKALYRRRMMRARWLRRLSIIIPFALLIFTPPPFRRLVFAWGTAPYLLLIPLGWAQHPITSDLTRWQIERGLRHRITTRSPAAITPASTIVGRFGKRLLITCVALELGIVLLHLILGREAYAEHMRILYRVGTGQEGLLAQITGNLAWGVHIGVVLAAILLAFDRRYRRDAAAEAAEAERMAPADAARERALQLAAEAVRPRTRDLTGRRASTGFGRRVAPAPSL